MEWKRISPDLIFDVAGINTSCPRLVLQIAKVQLLYPLVLVKISMIHKNPVRLLSLPNTRSAFPGQFSIELTSALKCRE
jgi:hypothetical protein